MQVPGTSEPGSWGRGAAPRERVHVGGWAWASLRGPLGGRTRAVAGRGSGREAWRGDPQAWPRRHVRRPERVTFLYRCPRRRRPAPSRTLARSPPPLLPPPLRSRPTRPPAGLRRRLGRSGRWGTWSSEVQEPTLPGLQSLEVSEELRPLSGKDVLSFCLPSPTLGGFHPHCGLSLLSAVHSPLLYCPLHSGLGLLPQEGQRP